MRPQVIQAKQNIQLAKTPGKGSSCSSTVASKRFVYTAQGNLRDYAEPVRHFKGEVFIGKNFTPSQSIALNDIHPQQKSRFY